jgi:hypothetical protein
MKQVIVSIPISTRSGEEGVLTVSFTRDTGCPEIEGDERKNLKQGDHRVKFIHSCEQNGGEDISIYFTRVNATSPRSKMFACCKNCQMRLHVPHPKFIGKDQTVWSLSKAFWGEN